LICSQARSASPSLSSAQYRPGGSPFCIQTNCSCPGISTAANVSFDSGLAWAPSAAAL
jgi:hypothetical protein